jgi:hypothetical protein
MEADRDNERNAAEEMPSQGTRPDVYENLEREKDAKPEDETTRDAYTELADEAKRVIKEQRGSEGTGFVSDEDQPPTRH